MVNGSRNCVSNVEKASIGRDLNTYGELVNKSVSPECRAIIHRLHRYNAQDAVREPVIGVRCKHSTMNWVLTMFL